MDYLDTLLKYTHITKEDINQFHYWLRTDPIGKADPDKKDKTRAEMLTIMMLFAGRLTIPSSYDEAHPVSADDLLKEIMSCTNDEKSTIFLFETLTRARLVMLTPEPAKGADFETETTYVYINPDYAKDVENCRNRAFLADEPQTH